MLDLVPPDDFSLFKDFQSIQLSRVLLLDQHDFSVRALANDRYHFKVFFGDVGSGQLLLVRHYLLVLLLQLLILSLLLSL